MQPPEDPGAPTADARTTRTDREFAAIVRGLAADDPRFVHRLSTPARNRLSTGGLMALLGVLLTVVVGVVPLVLGLHFGVTALLVIGAAGCALLPVAVPLIVRQIVRHRRPLRP